MPWVEHRTVAGFEDVLGALGVAVGQQLLSVTALEELSSPRFQEGALRVDHGVLRSHLIDLCVMH